MKRFWNRLFLPLLVVLVTAGLLWLLNAFKPEPVLSTPEPVIPAVDMFRVEVEAVPLLVTAQGTVQPRTETSLFSEVSGKVVAIAKGFKTGGFFKEGEVLVQIDPRDYETRLANARADLAEAQLRLALETAESRQAYEDWKAFGQSEADPLVLREPQLAQAQAAVESALANVKSARDDLERTSVKAPYDGLVLNKYVDIGQFVTGGAASPLADIYAIDYAEVRLPVSIQELALIDLPQVFWDDASSGDLGQTDKPQVTVIADYGDRRYAWQGWLDRAEGAVDTASRLGYVVCRVPDPYGKSDQSDRPPLRVGQFVEVEMTAQVIEGAAVIPRSALLDGDYVLIVSEDKRLYRRAVGVAQSNTETVIISSGLDAGDRVCLSRIVFFVEGMAVEPVEVSPWEKGVAARQGFEP